MSKYEWYSPCGYGMGWQNPTSPIPTCPRCLSTSWSTEPPVMTEPRSVPSTAAGRQMLAWLDTGEDPKPIRTFILAIEQEARVQERERLFRAVLTLAAELGRVNRNAVLAILDGDVGVPQKADSGEGTDG